MTPALIRCTGKTPEQAIDIMVQTDGGITSLGEGLSSLCRDILWGHHVALPFLEKADPDKRIRFGQEENLGSLVFGLLWPHFDNIETTNMMGTPLSRRYSHNQFVIGPINDKNLERAYYVYHVEFREYPGQYLGFENPKRVWISIKNDQLVTTFEGWPEDVLSMAHRLIAKEQDFTDDALHIIENPEGNRVNAKSIVYKISASPAKGMCDYEESAAFVRKFRVSAYDGDKLVGVLKGFIFDMYSIMYEGYLGLFDDSETTERLFMSLYHGRPLDIEESDVYKGCQPEFLKALNDHFGADMVSIEDDPNAWLEHYNISLGFVDSVDVEKGYRGLGIGSKMMGMLKRFRNSVDFMMLQSYPGEVEEKIQDLGLSHMEEIYYDSTPEGKKLYGEGQIKIDRFYSKLGYKPFTANGFSWMVMDKAGLRELERSSKKPIGRDIPENSPSM